MSQAESHKLQGNVYFGQHLYDDAIREYGKAIIHNPTIPTYYTNRALCFLRLEQYERAITDAEKAIEIDPKLVKGHYLLGQALSAIDTRLEGAIHALTKAYKLSIEQRVGYSEEIAEKLREAKKRKWELTDKKRRESESELYRYLTDLVERDRRRQLEQLDSADDAEKEAMSSQFDNRLSEITALFTKADETAKKREVPDYYTGKISFEIMTDPVITPSGITYDRPEIVSHLRKIGQFDPLSRHPMTEKDLIPNLALKEAIGDFLDKNGWAIDY
ncbi:uncharacterized protein SPPG_05721 [Spizellomyces punctatus DAOM BR117]|uniref:E3 ubiquitin-protein ligase CHIP n=1 Tax=Spizellomyces punctatus (strain DAOM BR117) TaxID=645134 RepID=A0A0L0HAY1_SPIPD|nr:uncharacterized protein SPPG_05721 [Spizellomyces punctatus DAOM BR117]KNC98740.1 hypothetical protein SPPG_05721 [Spizellomyces punctatus DAOM BR117]|eukprot:XP_016606780.1 hypothetical protein SPPG_05721 [Spizellomyces punctatus DAOM BR117]